MIIWRKKATVKTKSEIRKEIREKLNRQTEAERKQKSLAIKERFFKLTEFKKAKIIMLYVSTEFEVDTKGMIDDALTMGKRIAVPYIIGNEKKMVPSLIKDRLKDLAEGPYGIYQPRGDSYVQLEPSKIELVAVPGLAFTKEGIRLGRGGGYYDRFLKALPKETHAVGIAFDLQVYRELPHGQQDISVKKLITESS